MDRRMIALVATTLALTTSGGCGSKATGPPVYQFHTNDYEVEHDGEQKRITVGTGLVRVVRHPEDIEISQGHLRVGPREYGAVAIKDRISVVNGKVAVNGQERKPIAP